MELQGEGFVQQLLGVLGDAWDTNLPGEIFSAHVRIQIRPRAAHTNLIGAKDPVHSKSTSLYTLPHPARVCSGKLDARSSTANPNFKPGYVQ